MSEFDWMKKKKHKCKRHDCNKQCDFNVLYCSTLCHYLDNAKCNETLDEYLKRTIK